MDGPTMRRDAHILSQRPLHTLGLCLLLAFVPLQALADEPGPDSAPGRGLELRLHADGRRTNSLGPLAEANALAPGIASATPSAMVTELDWRDSWRTRLGALPVALESDLLLAHEWPRGEPGSRDRSRVKELHASADLGSWQLSAGRRVVAWDVGYGFRPIDVVQQEERRQLLGSTPAGRALLQAEYFGADDAVSLVWVNPQHWRDDADTQRRGEESALAARAYRRLGALDLHLLARRGRHTGWSAGGALAWVATDALELHASARLAQRHDGWSVDAAAGNAPARVNPWQLQTLDGGSQWLLGAQWTGAAQQSLLVEYWHDGGAPSDAQWRAWGERNAALRRLAAARPSVASAVAGNLAWQLTPMGGSAGLRQDNLFVRLAWQPAGWPTDRLAGSWQWTLDTLYHPADAGRIVTAGLQWQGDRMRINAAWRRHGGPDSALLAQLPQRASALLAVTWNY